MHLFLGGAMRLLGWISGRKSVLIQTSVLVGVFFTSAFLARPAEAVLLQNKKTHSGLYDNATGTPVYALIQQAKRTIDIEIYEMNDPQVIAALRAALARGVRVHIVKEPTPVGGTCRVFEPISKSIDLAEAALADVGTPCNEQKKLVQEVNAAGGLYVPFAKAAFCNGSKNCLEHGKLLVVDSEVVLVTTGNFNITNLCDLPYSPKTCNRDYSYVTRDAVAVRALQKVVESDLTQNAYDLGAILTKEVSSVVTVGPRSLDPILQFLKSAKHSIRIQNQYLKEPAMNQALSDAARRGVRVQIMVNSACSFGYPSPSERAKFTQIFSDFDAAGIQSRMFNKNITIQGINGYLHAKAIVIDDERAWVGSVNGSTQATTVNREFGVFFDDAADIKKLTQQIDRDFSDTAAESWQDSLECAENR